MLEGASPPWPQVDLDLDAALTRGDLRWLSRVTFGAPLRPGPNESKEQFLVRAHGGFERGDRLLAPDE